MTLKCHGIFEEKLTCSLENSMRSLANEELSLMTPDCDAKFEEESTFRFKTIMMNFTNFDLST